MYHFNNKLCDLIIKSKDLLMKAISYMGHRVALCTAAYSLRL